VLHDDLQRAAIGAGEQLGFVFVATLPYRANGVDDVTRFQIAAGGDDASIADGAR
jgi:hypothetical protein